MKLSELVRLRLSISDIMHRKIGEIDAAEITSKLSAAETDPANNSFAHYLSNARDLINKRVSQVNQEFLIQYNQIIGNLDHYIKQEAQQYINKDYSKFATTSQSAYGCQRP